MIFVWFVGVFVGAVPAVGDSFFDGSFDDWVGFEFDGCFGFDFGCHSSSGSHGPVSEWAMRVRVNCLLRQVMVTKYCALSVIMPVVVSWFRLCWICFQIFFRRVVVPWLV